MDYCNISKVLEHISAETTNRYLNIGWKLLYVGQLNDTETQYTAFVVGWPSEQGEPVEPEPDEPKFKFGTDI